MQPAALLGLDDELARRLDGLFVIQSARLTSTMISQDLKPFSKRLLHVQVVPGELEALFGATAVSLKSVEASKGYEGPPYRGIFLLLERMSRYYLSRLSFAHSGILIYSKIFDYDGTARFVG